MDQGNLDRCILVMLDKLWRISLMEKVSLNLMMVENMKDNGKIIKWMVMVHLHGLMEDNMMDMYEIIISSKVC